MGLGPTPLLLEQPPASTVGLGPTPLAWVQLYLQPVPIVELAHTQVLQLPLSVCSAQLACTPLPWLLLPLQRV